ncbi:MAG: hypothetical protein ABI411_11645 [Tahibacter sp.]
MSQNLVSLELSEALLNAVDQALLTLETALSGLVALTPAQRRSVTKMGVKSESFCRQTLSVLSQNPQLVAPNIGLADAQSDLAALDLLRPRIQRLARLSERAIDTESALGSDVMSAALKGYAMLKITGRGQGLDGLRKEIGTRFARGSRTPVDESTVEAQAA